MARRQRYGRFVPLLATGSLDEIAMGANVKLTASDGHQLGAYYSDPSGSGQSAVLVIQEIFGVNSHIRSVTDDFAAQGYHAIAAASFDPVQPAVELGRNSADIQ